VKHKIIEFLREINFKQDKINELQGSFFSVINSRRYRVGRTVIYPLTLLKKIIQKIKRKSKNILIIIIPRTTIRFFIVKEIINKSHYKSLYDLEFNDLKYFFNQKFDTKSMLRLSFLNNKSLNLINTYKSTEEHLLTRLFSRTDRIGQLKKSLSTLIYLKNMTNKSDLNLTFVKNYAEKGKSVILIDGRSLQNTGLLNRGVGAFGKSLIQEFDNLREHIVILCDPLIEVPSVLAEYKKVFSLDAQLLDAVRIFINLSPMTDTNPTILLPVLESTNIYKINILFDFIPLEFPSYYLKNFLDYTNYLCCLKALDFYDESLSISHSTAASSGKYTKKESKITVLPDEIYKKIFSKDLTTSLSCTSNINSNSSTINITCISGLDHRKNYTQTALSILAYAYSSKTKVKASFLGLSAISQTMYNYVESLNPLNLVEFHFLPLISEEEKIELIRSSHLTICLSEAEGLSLPVIESCTEGVPVVASNIPAHKELLGQGKWLVNANASSKVVEALRYVIKNRLLVSETQLDNLKHCDFISFKQVSEELKSKMGFKDKLLHNQIRNKEKTKVSEEKKMKNVAIVSPLPPGKSAIADFTINSLSAIDQTNTKLTFFATSSYSSSRNYPVVEENWGLLKKFDEIVLIYGNGHHHIPCFSILTSFSSSVLLHDTRYLELHSHIFDEANLKLNSDKQNNKFSLKDQLSNPKILEDRNLKYIMKAAKRIGTHSESLNKYTSQFYNRECTVFPLLPPLGQLTQKDFSQFEQKDIITFGVFGRLDPKTKCEDEIIRAIKILENQVTNEIKLVFVGEFTQNVIEYLQNLVVYLKIKSKILFTGHVDNQRYLQLMSKVNFGIDIRSSKILSLSGVVPELIKLGIPSLVTSGLYNDHSCPMFFKCIQENHISNYNLAAALLNLVNSNYQYAFIKKEIEEYSKKNNQKIYQEIFIDWINT
jgi:glycosyltransferase involved in cell wall biosynthesis